MKNYQYYAGLDQHHKMTRVIVIDQVEEVKVDATIRHNSLEQVKEEMHKLIPKGSLVALEATGFWYWMNDILEDCGYETILVHAKEVAEIAMSKKKSDRKDALIMAKLAKDGRLHSAYKMPREIRPIRDLLRHRTGLIGLKTCSKNQIHGVLHKLGIWHSASDLFGSRREAFLNSLDLDKAFKQIVDDHKYIIDSIRVRLSDTQRLIEKLSPEDELIKLLMTIPGVGKLLSRVIRYEIWDIERFESFKDFQSYIGLAPATYQSAESLYQGGITKEGNRHVRWAMIEAAQRIGRSDSYLNYKFNHLRKKKGRNKARVAIACELLQAVYYVWKRKEPYKAKPGPKISMRVIRMRKVVE